MQIERLVPDNFDAPLESGVDAPAAPAAETAPSAPPAFALSDDTLLPIKVGGVEQQIPWKDARTGFQLHGDYTRKMQELAEQRRSFEAERTSVTAQRGDYESKLSKIQELMGNPQALSSLYMLAQSRQQQGPQGPQPLTSEQVPGLMSTMKQEFAQQLQAYQQEQRADQERGQIANSFSQHTKGLLSKYPTLAVVEVDDIANRVATMRPRTLDEAAQYAQVVVESMHAKQQSAWSEQQKQSALAKQQLAYGIEPKGGQAPLPQPRNYKNASEQEAAMIDFLTQLGV